MTFAPLLAQSDTPTPNATAPGAVESGAIESGAIDPEATQTAADALADAATQASIFDFTSAMFYLVAAVLFIVGLKMLSSPRTARQGNVVAAFGMLVAVIVTLVGGGIGWDVVIAGFVVGGAIGLFAARRVEMTQMPELVALFNGSGGIASAVVAAAEFWGNDVSNRPDQIVSINLALLVGMITFTGSVIAFMKLSGKRVPLPWYGKTDALDREGQPKRNDSGQILKEWKVSIRIANPQTFPLQHALNLALLLLVATVVFWSVTTPAANFPIVLMILLAAVLGVLLTVPIGGADMPVVVSLLNSYSGIAASFAGFTLENVGLIVSGSLVGASGLILTSIMCKAMNRSLISVLAGGFGQETTAAGATDAQDKPVRQMDGEEAAMVLEAAQSVVIIPGYGMAIAQAQHTVAELASLLGSRDIRVRFGVHPVAGRMPGHMNVLLAEANVPYEQLSDLELNSEMEQVDVALIIGANDVVNLDARRPESQIAGMPIFDVDKARTVMVCKRSLNPGFAGIQNPLFFNDNTVMLFGDAKAMISDVVTHLKER